MLNIKFLKIKSFLILILILINFFIFKNIFAESNIDTELKYAWGDGIGWVNFNPTNGNLNVSNTEITGYAWSQNFGWINMNPTNSGVKNDGIGNLSGYAWGEGVGWIDFNNVNINNQGVFNGLATTENSGSINFNCTNCMVKTTWSSGIISADFIDALGNNIDDPIINIPSTMFSLEQKAVSTYIVNNGNRIKIENTTQNPLWTISISPTNGEIATWINEFGDTYKINGTDSEGNMEIDPTEMNIVGTGIIKGNKQKFISGLSSIMLASSTNSSQDSEFYLDNLKVTQVLPANQKPGTYNLEMTLTILQN